MNSRVPIHHPKKGGVQEELNKERAGYNGEQVIDYRRSFLLKNEYFLLLDLRLRNPRGFFFQIDNLVLPF